MIVTDKTSNAIDTKVIERTWQHFGSAWETGDTSGFDDWFAADLVYHMAPFPDMNREALKGFVSAFHAGFPDFSINTDEEICSGATSVHQWRCTATFSGNTSILPVPPTGQPTAATGNLLLHWSDDRIIEAWHAGDWLGWLTKAGVLPPLSPA